MKKETLIKKIKGYIDEMGPTSVGELVADCSPYLGWICEEDHLVEKFEEEEAEVVVYGGYKNQEEVESYWVNYEDLPKKVLKEIKELLELNLED